MKDVLFVSLLCAFLQVACTRGTESTTQASRESEVVSDSDLAKQIEAKINSDAQLRDADLSVSADAERHIATISGTVQSESLRTKAVEMARSVRSGMTIEDKIDVQPLETERSEYTAEQAQREVQRAQANKESVGDDIDDAWIHAKIVTKLVADLKISERTINVDVNKNIVTLRGTVDTPRHRLDAEKIARETEGVKQVNNRLRVSKS
jgi:hyperosmotically inducible periplasmic protein